MDGIEKSLKKKEEKMNTGGEVREGGGGKRGYPLRATKIGYRNWSASDLLTLLSDGDALVGDANVHTIGVRILRTGMASARAF